MRFLQTALDKDRGRRTLVEGTPHREWGAEGGFQGLLALSDRAGRWHPHLKL